MVLLAICVIRRLVKRLMLSLFSFSHKRKVKTMNRSKNNIKLPVGRRLGAVTLPNTTAGNEHHTQVVVVGKGTENFNFPSPTTLVSNALQREDAKKAKGKSKTRARKSTTVGKQLVSDETARQEAERFKHHTPVSADTRAAWQEASPRAQALKVEFHGAVRQLLNAMSADSSDEIISNLEGLGSSNRIITGLPQGETKESYTDGKVLLAVADMMQKDMMARQFDGLYEARFGRLVTAVEWALANMEAEYQPAFQSLNAQLEKLIESYKAALPQLIAELSKRNPGAPLMAVVQKAIELLDEELAQILYVLRVYTDCVEQRRDGKFARQLNSCAFFFKCVHQLYWTGDLENALKGKATSPIKGGAEQVGAVFLARVTASGLATIPGSRGPIGAHALQVPYEMLDFLVINFPLFCHESRHNVYHDVVGLEEQATKAMQKDILAAIKSGLVKLSVSTITVGKQKLPADQMFVKIITDWLGEIDADGIAVLFTGESFGDSMISSFPAMMIRDAAVSTKSNLLRTSSHFDLVKTKSGVALQFAPHPVDYVRVYFVAALFDEIGFPEAATRLRKLADFAVGDEIPENVTFEHSDEEGKVDLTIEVPTKDFLALAPVVMKSLIRTKHEALGGNSNADLVMWTAKRQEKVILLKETLKAGKNDVPTDKGDIHVTYVAAAAISAVFDLVREGKANDDTLKHVSENAMVMLETLKARADKAKA